MKHATTAKVFERYLERVCNRLPTVKKVIDTYGSMPLLEYAQTLIPTPGAPSFQSRSDVLKIIYHYVEPLLGESVAQQTVNDLEAYPVVLTASHHGVEYFSQTFQTRLIFSLNLLKNIIPTTTILVFACGNIPIDNASYPRGILVYDVEPDKIESIPVKLPVFPDRLKRSITSAIPGFTPKMIDRARVKATQMKTDKHFSGRIFDTLQHILPEIYMHESVAALSLYSDQAVVVNSLIWNDLFSLKRSIPKSICLELENVVGKVLESDLSNPCSLIGYILFDANLRTRVIEHLNGINGCWNREFLRPHPPLNGTDNRQAYPLKQCGTLFFWGVDDKGRKFSLNIQTDNTDKTVLYGIDDSKNTWKWALSEKNLIEGISSGHLIPSVFTCFAVLLFARGIACIGGYFQGSYLPEMKKGLLSALADNPKYTPISAMIDDIRTDYYLDGMQSVMKQINSRFLVPAGPLEIISRGGITSDDLEKMAGLTVREAHLADMFETVQDVVPPKTLPPGWKEQLAHETYQLLKHKTVIK